MPSYASSALFAAFVLGARAISTAYAADPLDLAATPQLVHGERSESTRHWCSAFAASETG